MIVDCLLKDALNNLSADSGASDEYRRGLLVGVVSTLIAVGMKYTDAIDLVARNLPKFYVETGVPPAWAADIVFALSDLEAGDEDRD